jgi:hypothetical protein
MIVKNGLFALNLRKLQALTVSYIEAQIRGKTSITKRGAAAIARPRPPNSISSEQNEKCYFINRKTKNKTKKTARSNAGTKIGCLRKSFIPFLL